MQKLKQYMKDTAGSSHEITQRGNFVRIDSFKDGIKVDGFMGRVQGDVTNVLKGGN